MSDFRGRKRGRGSYSWKNYRTNPGNLFIPNNPRSNFNNFQYNPLPGSSNFRPSRWPVNYVWRSPPHIPSSGSVKPPQMRYRGLPPMRQPFTPRGLFLTPPNFNGPLIRTRPPSPLPGSEEARQKTIAEASARIKEQLNLSEPTSSIPSVQVRSDIDSISDKMINQSKPLLKTPEQSKKKIRLKTPRKPTVNKEELRTKIVKEISTMSKGKLQSLINNPGFTKYDAALQHLLRDARLNVSSELRTLYNTRSNDNEFVNSVVPDLGVDIALLPDTLVDELSNILELDLNDPESVLDDTQNEQDKLNNVLIEPEQLFKQAELMLSNTNDDTINFDFSVPPPNMFYNVHPMKSEEPYDDIRLISEPENSIVLGNSTFINNCPNDLFETNHENSLLPDANLIEQCNDDELNYYLDNPNIDQFNVNFNCMMDDDNIDFTDDQNINNFTSPPRLHPNNQTTNLQKFKTQIGDFGTQITNNIGNPTELTNTQPTENPTDNNKTKTGEQWNSFPQETNETVPNEPPNAWNQTGAAQDENTSRMKNMKIQFKMLKDTNKIISHSTIFNDIENEVNPKVTKLNKHLHNNKNEKLNEAENQRLKEIENQRLKEAENQRIKEAENRLNEAEDQRLKEAENERLREVENERLKEVENETLSTVQNDEMTQKEIDERFKRDKNERLRQDEADRLRLEVNERLKQKEPERLKQKESERLKQEEADKMMQDINERLKQKENDRSKQKEEERLRNKEEERLRHKEEERLRHKEEERLKHKEEERLRHKEEERLKHKEEERLRHKEEERLRQKEEERLRHKEEERLRHKEEERLRQKENERSRYKENEKLRYRENEKFRQNEKSRENDRWKPKENDKPRQRENEKFRHEKMNQVPHGDKNKEIAMTNETIIIQDMTLMEDINILVDSDSDSKSKRDTEHYPKRDIDLKMFEKQKESSRRFDERSNSKSSKERTDSPRTEDYYSDSFSDITSDDLSDFEYKRDEKPEHYRRSRSHEHKRYKKSKKHRSIDHGKEPDKTNSEPDKRYRDLEERVWITSDNRKKKKHKHQKNYQYENFNITEREYNKKEHYSNQQQSQSPKFRSHSNDSNPEKNPIIISIVDNELPKHTVPLEERMKVFKETVDKRNKHDTGWNASPPKDIKLDQLQEKMKNLVETSRRDEIKENPKEKTIVKQKNPPAAKEDTNNLLFNISSVPDIKQNIYEKTNKFFRQELLNFNIPQIAGSTTESSTETDKTKPTATFTKTIDISPLDQIFEKLSEENMKKSSPRKFGEKSTNHTKTIQANSLQFSSQEDPTEGNKIHPENDKINSGNELEDESEHIGDKLPENKSKDLNNRLKSPDLSKDRLKLPDFDKSTDVSTRLKSNEATDSLKDRSKSDSSSDSFKDKPKPTKSSSDNSKDTLSSINSSKDKLKPVDSNNAQDKLKHIESSTDSSKNKLKPISSSTDSSQDKLKCIEVSTDSSKDKQKSIDSSVVISLDNSKLSAIESSTHSSKLKSADSSVDKLDVKTTQKIKLSRDKKSDARSKDDVAKESKQGKDAGLNKKNLSDDGLNNNQNDNAAIRTDMGKEDKNDDTASIKNEENKIGNEKKKLIEKKNNLELKTGSGNDKKIDNDDKKTESKKSDSKKSDKELEKKSGKEDRHKKSEKDSIKKLDDKKSDVQRKLDKESDRKSDKESDREFDKKLDKENEKKFHKESNKKSDKESDRKLDKESDRKLDKGSDKKLDKDSDKKSDKESDKKSNKEPDKKLIKPSDKKSDKKSIKESDKKSDKKILDKKIDRESEKKSGRGLDKKSDFIKKIIQIKNKDSDRKSDKENVKDSDKKSSKENISDVKSETVSKRKDEKKSEIKTSIKKSSSDSDIKSVSKTVIKYDNDKKNRKKSNDDKIEKLDKKSEKETPEGNDKKIVSKNMKKNKDVEAKKNLETENKKDSEKIIDEDKTRNLEVDVKTGKDVKKLRAKPVVKKADCKIKLNRDVEVNKDEIKNKDEVKNLDEVKKQDEVINKDEIKNQDEGKSEVEVQNEVPKKLGDKKWDAVGQRDDRDEISEDRSGNELKIIEEKKIDKKTKKIMKNEEEKSEIKIPTMEELQKIIMGGGCGNREAVKKISIEEIDRLNEEIGFVTEEIGNVNEEFGNECKDKEVSEEMNVICEENEETATKRKIKKSSRTRNKYVDVQEEGPTNSNKIEASTESQTIVQNVLSNTKTCDNLSKTADVSNKNVKNKIDINLSKWKIVKNNLKKIIQFDETRNENVDESSGINSTPEMKTPSRSEDILQKIDALLESQDVASTIKNNPTKDSSPAGTDFYGFSSQNPSPETGNKTDETKTSIIPITRDENVEHDNQKELKIKLTRPRGNKRKKIDSGDVEAKKSKPESSEEESIVERKCLRSRTKNTETATTKKLTRKNRQKKNPINSSLDSFESDKNDSVESETNPDQKPKEMKKRNRNRCEALDGDNEVPEGSPQVLQESPEVLTKPKQKNKNEKITISHALFGKKTDQRKNRRNPKRQQKPETETPPPILTPEIEIPQPIPYFGMPLMMPPMMLPPQPLTSTPKPIATSHKKRTKEEIINRMMIIDIEIQKLMQEKLDLYKELQTATEIEVKTPPKTHETENDPGESPMLNNIKTETIDLTMNEDEDSKENPNDENKIKNETDKESIVVTLVEEACNSLGLPMSSQNLDTHDQIKLIIEPTDDKKRLHEPSFPHEAKRQKESDTDNDEDKESETVAKSKNRRKQKRSKSPKKRKRDSRKKDSSTEQTPIPSETAPVPKRSSTKRFKSESTCQSDSESSEISKNLRSRSKLLSNHSPIPLSDRQSSVSRASSEVSFVEHSEIIEENKKKSKRKTKVEQPNDNSNKKSKNIIPCFVQLQRMVLPTNNLTNDKSHINDRLLDVTSQCSKITEDECLIVSSTSDSTVTVEKDLLDDGIFCTAHTKSILDLKVFGDEFLAASEDGCVYRYCLKTGKLNGLYLGHLMAVTCLHVPKDTNDPLTRVFFSGSLDCSLKCYKMESCELIQNITIEQAIQCMDSAWGYIFLGTYDGLLFIYDIKRKRLHEDSITVASATVLMVRATTEGSRQVLILASRKREIMVRDAFTGLLLRTMCEEQKPTIYSLLLERSFVYCGTSDKGILILDFNSGNQIRTYNAGKGVVCMLIYRSLLFAGCYDGMIYIYDTRTNSHISTINGPGEGMLLSLTIVNDLIIAGTKKDHLLKIWRIPDEILRDNT